MKKSKETVIYCITANSESGDNYGPWLFAKKPSNKQLKEFLREVCPGEFDNADAEDKDNRGPGAFGSYLYLSFSEATLIVL